MKTKTKTYKLKPTNSVEGMDRKYDWVYSWITPEHCPLKPLEGEQDIELISFDKYISTEDALKEMEALGYTPAPSNYLLSLGIDYPDVLKENKWIVSLDENNLLPNEDGDGCVLSLDWIGRRDLSLTGREGGWGVVWWFAVIRKSSGTLPSPLVPLKL